jgi:hypothetical protein
MGQAGRLEQIDPPVWARPWHVHSQAIPNGHLSFTSLAPSGFTVAIATSRLGSRQDRTSACTSRPVGRARLRTAHLDARECIRRFLQHVLPDGFLKGRHFGLLHASCAIPPDTIRLMILQTPPSDGKPTPPTPPAPFVAFCPTCGGQMRVVMRLWTPPGPLSIRAERGDL